MSRTSPRGTRREHSSALEKEGKLKKSPLSGSMAASSNSKAKKVRVVKSASGQAERHIATPETVSLDKPVSDGANLGASSSPRAPLRMNATPASAVRAEAMTKTKTGTPRSVRKIQRRRQVEAMLDDGDGDGLEDEDDDGLQRAMSKLTRGSRADKTDGLRASDDDEREDSNDQTRERSASLERLSRLQEAPHERYFTQMKDSSKTSGSSLAQLPTVDAQTYLDILSRSAEWTPERVKAGQRALMETYLDERYAQELISFGFAGFNTLLHGYGSKRAILNNIANRLQGQSHPCVVINGFFPGLKVVQMVNDLAKFLDVTHEKGTALTAAELTNQIVARYSSEVRPHLFVVVHSIDAEPVRSPVFQTTFAKLASATRIHFIASSDHINAPLLWPPPLDELYGWIPRNATTFIPYDLELRFDLLGGSVAGVKRSKTVGFNSMIDSGSNSVSGILHVMEALPDKSLKVFMILARYLVETAEQDVLGSMTFDHLLQKASEEFLAQRADLLRTMLNDFKDHEIVMTGRSQDGTETLTVPLSRALLVQLLAELMTKL